VKARVYVTGRIWFVHPRAEDTWRFVRWYFGLGIVLHALSAAVGAA
jgi:hypothetical protein